MRTRSSPWTRLTLLLLALALTATSARASHYPLDQARAIIPADEAKRLRKAGVRTTADLLVWGRTAQGRSLLAQRARLAPARVVALVEMADLLRVRGIGPDVARLLVAVGVPNLAALQQADPTETAVAIKTFNDRTHLSTNPPGSESLRYWIQLARGMEILLGGP